MNSADLNGKNRVRFSIRRPLKWKSFSKTILNVLFTP